MARISPIIFLMLIALSSACGGSDLNAKTPESAWQLDEPADLDAVSTTPEGLPQNYINHPASERRHPGPWSTECDIPFGYTDHYPHDGKMKHPIIGSMMIIGLAPQEFEPEHIDVFNYNLYMRLPRKSDVWHRFEIRRPSGEMSFDTKFRLDWNNAEFGREYFIVNPVAIGLTLATRDCQLPTQQDLEQFVYEYGEFNAIFHNPVTGAIYRFDPGDADGTKIYDPLMVLNDKSPVNMTWDLPINRPKQRLPVFLENR